MFQVPLKSLNVFQYYIIMGHNNVYLIYKLERSTPINSHVLKSCSEGKQAQFDCDIFL